METAILPVSPKIATTDGKLPQDLSPVEERFDKILAKQSPSKEEKNVKQNINDSQNNISKKIFESSKNPSDTKIVTEQPESYSPDKLESDPSDRSNLEPIHSTLSASAIVESIQAFIPEGNLDNKAQMLSDLSPISETVIQEQKGSSDVTLSQVNFFNPQLEPSLLTAGGPTLNNQDGRNTSQTLNKELLAQPSITSALTDQLKLSITDIRTGENGEVPPDLNSFTDISLSSKASKDFNSVMIKGQNGLGSEETLIVDLRNIKIQTGNHFPSDQVSSISQEIMGSPSGEPGLIKTEKGIGTQLETVVQGLQPKTLATDQNRIQGVQFSNEATFLGENNEKINLTLNSFGAENGFIVNSLTEKLGSTGKTDPISEKNGMTPFTEAKNQGVDRFLALDGQEAHQRIISSEPGEMKSDHGVSPLKTDPLEIYQQIGKQVLWSIKNGEEKIKLALDPPHLGNIYMEINREKENIKATLWTDNSVTKEILETHQIQLQKILGEDGFKLEKFNVLVQQDMGSFQQQEEKSINHGSWRKRGFEEGKSLSPGPLDVSPLVANFSHRGSIYVDLFV